MNHYINNTLYDVRRIDSNWTIRIIISFPVLGE